MRAHGCLVGWRTKICGDEYTLRLMTALRRDLSPQQAGAALELARLRKKAVRKFGD